MKLLPLTLASLVTTLTLSGCASVETAKPQPQWPGLAAADTDPRGDMMYQVLVAEIAGREGQMDVATRHYVDAALVSDDARIAERATRLAVYAHDIDRASLAAQRWAALTPDSLEAHEVLAGLHIRKQQITPAADELSQIIKLAHANPDQGISLVVNMLSREPDVRSSAAVMAEMAARYPGSALAHYGHAVLADRVGDSAPALNAVERSLQIKPDFYEAIILRSQLLLNLGRNDEAFALLHTAIQQYPTEVSLRMAQARLLVSADQFEAAAKTLRELYADHGDNSNLVYTLGLLALEARQLQDAEAYLTRVLSLGGHDDEASYYLGRIADNQHDYEKAIYHYQNVDNGEHQFDAQLRIADMLARLGRIEDARNHISRLRILNPDPENAVRFYLAEAEVLRQAADYDGALDLLSAALEQHQQDPDLLYARALSAERLNRQDLFETDLQAVLAQEPDNTHALNALGYFWVDRNERLPEAEQYIRKAYAQLPDDAAIIDSMGWLEYRLGHHELALQYLRDAYARFPDPEVAAHLGEVLWVIGQKTEADAIWQAALQAAPDNKILLRVIQRLKQ